LTEELELQVQPIEIQQTRVLMDGSMKVLVQWKDLPEFENTWEEYSAIAKQFPDFSLEDKGTLLGGEG